MYDELIKRLRECATEVNCIGCDCNNSLIKQAADAIEELQKQLREEKVDNVNLTGWLAEEHANQCPHYIRNVHDRGDDSLCTKWECEVKALPKWIPVTERLPEKNQEVLIFLFGDDPYIAWHNGKYWCTEDFRLDEPDDWQPTYWFPLPQPPKDGEP